MIATTYSNPFSKLSILTFSNMDRTPSFKLNYIQFNIEQSNKMIIYLETFLTNKKRPNNRPFIVSNYTLVLISSIVGGVSSSYKALMY